MLRAVVCFHMEEPWEEGLGHHYVAWCMCAMRLQSCPPLCSPTDCSLPGSSVHDSPGNSLEWAAVLSSRGSSHLRDYTHVSYIYLHWQVGSLSLVPSGKAYRQTSFTSIQEDFNHERGPSLEWTASWDSSSLTRSLVLTLQRLKRTFSWGGLDHKRKPLWSF